MKTRLGFYGFIIIVIISLSTSCHGETWASGIVYDVETSMPLDSVQYKRLGSEPIIKYTDSTGAYDMYGETGGCLPDCPDISLEFSKPGYISQRHRNPQSKSIYLEREEE